MCVRHIHSVHPFTYWRNADTFWLKYTLYLNGNIRFRIMQPPFHSEASLCPVRKTSCGGWELYLLNFLFVIKMKVLLLSAVPVHAIKLPDILCVVILLGKTKTKPNKPKTISFLKFSSFNIDKSHSILHSYTMPLPTYVKN